MSSTRQGLLNANNPQRADGTTDLNSLASNGVKLCTVTLSNVQADGKGLGYPEVKGKLTLASAAFTQSPYIYGWLLQADDGTNYETYNTGATATTPPCARPPDFTWAVDAVTQACIRDSWAAFGAPICANMQLLIWNQTGVQLAASGNSVNLYYSTDQFN